ASVSMMAMVNNSDMNAAACGKLGLIEGTNCHYSSSGGTDTVQIWNTNGTPLSLPQVKLTSKTNIVLKASTVAGISNEYDFNSLDLTSQATISVDTPDKSAKVIVRVAGKDNTGTPVADAVNFDGGSIASPQPGCPNCSAYDAALMQFVYSGTGGITF